MSLYSDCEVRTAHIVVSALWPFPRAVSFQTRGVPYIKLIILFNLNRLTPGLANRFRFFKKREC